jgi:hypothetical protein
MTFHLASCGQATQTPPRCIGYWMELLNCLANLGLVALEGTPCATPNTGIVEASQAARAGTVQGSPAACQDGNVTINAEGQVEVVKLCASPGDNGAAMPNCGSKTKRMACSAALLQAERASGGDCGVMLYNVRPCLRAFLFLLVLLASLFGLMPCGHAETAWVASTSILRVQ